MRRRPCRHPIFAALPVAVLAVVLSLAGCRAGQTRNAASVVDFLYPNTKAPVVSEEIPVLSLPVRVGVAWVPSSRSGPHGYQGVQEPLSEDRRLALLQEVADHFEQRPFVESIQVIPSAYLRPGGSFENLDQLALTEPFTLDSDTFVTEIRRLRGPKRPLTAAALRSLRDEHSRTIAPMAERLIEAERIERELADLVNQAYGLTPEEVDLMWRTAPPRMPPGRPAAGAGPAGEPG